MVAHLVPAFIISCHQEAAQEAKVAAVSSSEQQSSASASQPAQPGTGSVAATAPVISVVDASPLPLPASCLPDSFVDLMN